MKHPFLLRRMVAAFGVAGILLASAPAQVESRPASVLLVATVESLSLGVAPASYRMQPGTAYGDSAGEQNLVVTSMWAVPARLTTFRLEIFPVNAADRSVAPHVLWSMPAGPTNQADSFARVLKAADLSAGDDRKHAEQGQQRVIFQIEAL